MSDKLKYTQRLRAKLNVFYLQVRDCNNKDAVMASGIEAFMEAGLTLGAVSRSELEEVIADEHQSVFGMSLLERSQAAKEEAMEKEDYAFFDVPTWERERR